MPYALPAIPGLDQYQSYTPEDPTYAPRADLYAPAPPAPPMPSETAPVARSYSPQVERWRPLVSQYFKPEDVDKALYVISGESGGDPTIRNREGSGATGLFQIMPFHGIKATDPEESIRWAANQVYNVRGGWQDWGEGATYQGKPFGILGLAPYNGTSSLDSWESPQQALAGRSTVSGQPVGRAMPAISAGVDYSPASEEGINQSKLNSASRAIINNPEILSQDARFDVTTNPENRSVNGVGFGDWVNRQIEPLVKAQNVAGNISANYIGDKLDPLNALDVPLAPVREAGTALKALGIDNPLKDVSLRNEVLNRAKIAEPVNAIRNVGEAAGRVAGESLVPTRPWEVALTALPAVGKLDDAAAAARAVIGIDEAPRIAAELDTLPQRALNAARRRFPESPSAEGARATNFLRTATAGASDEIPDSLPDAVVNAAKQKPGGIPPSPPAPAPAAAPVASEGDAVMALRNALREGKGGERAAIVSAGRKSQAARLAGALETSDQTGVELAREAGRAGAGKILPEGGIGFKLPPEADDVLVEKAMALYREGKLSVFDAVYGVPKALDEGRRLGPTPAQAKLLSKLTDIDEYDFLPFVRQRNVFEKASKESLAAELAKVGEGEAADVAVQLKAAKRAQILADKAAALGKSEQAAKLRLKANQHTLKADQLERASTERYNARAAAKFERDASKAAKVEAEQARRAIEKLTEQSPNPEMILRKALPPQYGPGLSADVESMDTAKAIIGEHLRGNRAILDNIKDSEGLREVVSSVRAALTGELADSYLTSLVYRNMALRHALIEGGMEPKMASTVAKSLRQVELDQRFPGGVPERIQNELDAMKAAPYEESLKGLELGVQRWKNTAFSIDLGIFGGQVLAALRRGNVALLAGSINRTLAALHLPNVATHVADAGLNKQLRNILDGVHTGAGSGAIEPEAGTVLSYLGPAGKKLDQAIGPALQKVNDVQFSNVLGSMGDLAYEGNLVMMHVLGRDISDPKVRAVAADTANSIRSFANTALRSQRGGIERTMLTSAAMTRAQVANILQMSKLLNGSTEQRIMAAGLIASQAAFYLTVGKFINDQIGVTDFVMNPAEAGFGKITLPVKNAAGRNLVIDMFPQSSVDKAIARSFDELAGGDEEKALDTWLAYFSGRASPAGRVALGLGGVGYGSDLGSNGFSGVDVLRGQSPGLSVKDRLLNIAPLPPIVQSVLAQAGDGGVDATSNILEWVGFNTNPESTAGIRNREAQQRFINDKGTIRPRQPGEKGIGVDYRDLLPSQQKEINDLPNIANFSEQDKKSAYKKAKDAAYGDIQARQDQAEAAFQSGNLTQPLPDLWRRLSDERKGARVGLQESFKKELNSFDRDKFDKAVEGYYAIEAKSADGTVDWDKTELSRKQYIDNLGDKERTWLNDFLGVQEQNNSPLRKQYFDYLDKREAAGYFREGITTAEKTELDRQNPDIDVQTWFFLSGIKDQKNTPALQSAEAVNKALDMNLPGRQVKLAGLGRTVNESTQTIAAWKESGDKLASFIDGSRADKYLETVAQRKYKKPFASLTESQQSAVKSYINTKLRVNNPDIDAALAWFGKYSVVQSRQGAITLRELRKKYGKEPEGTDGPVRLVKGAA